MRYGFTTGSCAAAAAKAAAYMLLTGKEKKEITIDTPKGILYHARLEEIRRSENCVSCAIRKDGGDDPDITTGALVFVSVSVQSEYREEPVPAVQIEGGEGVGRVTKPGLDQPVGNAAINRVPRKMIEKEVTEICTLTDFKGSLLVTVCVPEGETLAKKTFNPRLGITGGISILGTTGIVEPMSTQAILDTIKTELNVVRASGMTAVAVTPGNYGLDFMKRAYGYDLDKSVKCSNFIGDTIDMAVEMGFCELLLTGHIGKLIKLSGGIMNTHSKEGDCRMELLASAGIRAEITASDAREILDCVTTEEAVRLLAESGKLEEAMREVMEKACFYLNKRAAGRIGIECIMYANGLGELAGSAGAKALLEKIKKAQK
ncbi:MAG: cobalt-precorrin-5B (C(1))-methyltransferase CbiD [Lachnospiraceae bacterium]